MIAAIALLGHHKISCYHIDSILCLTGEEAHVNTLKMGGKKHYSAKLFDYHDNILQTSFVESPRGQPQCNTNGQKSKSKHRK